MGIVGYVGFRAAAEILLGGLRRLEYGGYDSSGIAVVNHSLHVVKSKGRLKELEAKLQENALHGSIGIAHTRWATHGAPSDTNAHPHIDCSGSIAIVHNGILENEAELRQRLSQKGHRFVSETDSEVFAHLIEEHYEGDLVAAVRAALAEVRGSYALAVMHRDHPDHIVAARKDNPAVIGLGKGETFLASDIPAVLEHTRRFVVLKDGEIAQMFADRVDVFAADGRKTEQEVLTVDWDLATAEKDGYEHFMLKEIHEQPRAIANALRGRLRSSASQNGAATADFTLEGIGLPEETVRALDQVYLIGCGTAYHAGLLGAAFIKRLAKLRAEADIASEFRYSDPQVGPGTLAIFVSQSGETADTLAALREAKRLGCVTLGVVNAVGSTMAREADYVLYTQAGPEIAIASTKAYVTQVTCLLQVALYLGQLRGTLPADVAPLIQSLMELPALAEQVIASSAEPIRRLAQRWANMRDAYYIGRGIDLPVAMEGQLKLKEVTYIHAEALAAGELKHGPLALIEPGMPVVALATQAELYDKLVSNVREVRARGADVLGIAAVGADGFDEICNEVIRIPQTHALLTPLLAVLPLQLLAYEVAVARGCDVDNPRNLVKSVTVE